MTEYDITFKCSCGAIFNKIHKLGTSDYEVVDEVVYICSYPSCGVFITTPILYTSNIDLKFAHEDIEIKNNIRNYGVVSLSILRKDKELENDEKLIDALYFTNVPKENVQRVTKHLYNLGMIKDEFRLGLIQKGWEL